MIIQKGDELACVPEGNLEGYEGWEVVGRIDGPPPEHADWDGKKFVVDEGRREWHEENARLRCLAHYDRHQEAVECARRLIIKDLQEVGVLSEFQAMHLLSKSVGNKKSRT
jgi:hypothetical protein